MSSVFCIDREAIGAKSHFCLSEKGFSWVDDPPEDAWVFRHTPKMEDPRCLNTLLRLNGHEVTFDVPPAQVRAMKTAMRSDFSFEKVPWQLVLSAEEYRRCLVDLSGKIHEATKAVDSTYHQEVFLRVTGLFQAMDYASINVKVLEEHLANEKNQSNRSTLESFRPTMGSFAKKTVYDRFGSRTGRPTVESGPQILTLKREYRDIIKSSFPGGKVFYVDYAALEARAFLTVMGREVHEPDIYGMIANRFFVGQLTRSVVKLATLAFLFGAVEESIQGLLKASKTKTKDFLDRVSDLFGLDDLRKRLYAEWVANNKQIRNFYGRVIPVPDESTLVNSFVQSTGADVAQLGFLNIVTSARKHDLKVRPVFLLHDAMFLDVHPQHHDQMDSIIFPGTMIPKMGNSFFMTHEELSYT